MAKYFARFQSVKQVWLRSWTVLSLTWCALAAFNGLPIKERAPTLDELEQRTASSVLEFRKRCTRRNLDYTVELKDGTHTLCFDRRAQADVYFKWTGRAYRAWRAEDQRKQWLNLAMVILLPPLLLATALFAIEWILLGAGRGFLFYPTIASPAPSAHNSPQPPEHNSNRMLGGEIGLSSTTNRIAKPGVHGWLKTFCVLLTVIFPLFALSACSEAASYDASVNYVSDPLSAAKYLVAAGSTVMGTWSFFAGLAIWRGSHNGKRAALIFLFAYPVIALLTTVAAVSALRSTEGYELIKVDLVMYTLAKAAFSAAWIAYFLRSKRVEMLYGHSIMR